MSPALFPEMAQSAFQPLLGRLKESPLKQEFSLIEVQDLLEASSFGANLLDSLWGTLEVRLLQGIESSRLSRLLAELTPTVEGVLHEVYARVWTIADGQMVPAEEKQKALRKLDECRSRAIKILTEMAELKKMADRPRPTMDPAWLDSLAAKTPSGEGEDVSDILARLRAGGAE